MAKRELIDRKQAVEVVSNGFDRWHMINLLASQGSVPTITEQEIVKPYLDKIRAEVKALSPAPTAYDVVDGNPVKDAVWEIIGDVLQIIDKYKAESEVSE